jgi:hypothetical protein
MIVAFGADLDQGLTLGVERIAGTTMHELGHNLGLEHGSLADVAPQTCLTEKPNYVSVMGYLYQNGIHVATAPGSTQGMLCDSDADCATGVCATPGACHCTSDLAPANSCYRVDYEADHLLDLDEAHLDETVGVGGPAGDQDIVWFLADSALAFGGAHGPINWNQRNDIETDVAMDLDNDNGTPNTILKTTTDWDKLQLAFQCSSSWGAGAGTGPRPPSAIEPGLLALRARHVAYSPLSVRIDVRPGAASNWIAVGGAGNVPVAIYGSPRLAVSTIDQASLALDAVPAVAARTFDVDGDGHDDLIIDFPMASLPVTATSTRLTLTGWQTSSRMLSGSDVIVPVASAGPGPARR